MDSCWILVNNGLILNFGTGITNIDIIMPISFPAYKSIDMAVHIGTEPTCNIVSHSQRAHDTTISHYVSSVRNGVDICWIAIGY